MSYAAHMASLLEMVWKLHLVAIHEEATRCGLEPLLSYLHLVAQPVGIPATREQKSSQFLIVSYEVARSGPC